MSKENMPANDDKTLYELGFHFVPTIAEEDLEKEVDTIKSLIKTNNGEVVLESKPVFLKLAYTIVKNLDSKNYKYDTSFFGWIKFNADGSDVKEIQSELDLSNSIIRYMIVKTTKEANIKSEDVASFLNDDEKEVDKIPDEEVEDLSLIAEKIVLEEDSSKMDAIDEAIGEIVGN